ncbi:MAG TPA: lysophospholipid acyltransferase family protein [Pyrinomonadaceae bacterium]|nr:lysophospholipid acyltransferase family protein [Pyrinomonadaceae bacterium]
MSEAMNSQGERAGQSAEPKPAPQWLVDYAIRPAVGVISRVVWRISFRGVEHIPLSGGLVIAANHQTYVDPFWISVPFRRPIRYLAWNEAFKKPLMGKALDFLGAWPLALERGNPTAYRRSLKWLREGGAVMIFPEGERSVAHGRVARFKTGAVRLALEVGAAVLPVTIRGGEKVWPRGQMLPRTGRVEIVFHPVRHLAILPGEDARRCIQRETEALAAVIKAAL